MDATGRPYRAERSGNDTAQAVVRRRDSKLQARYDAAQTSHDNKRHWANADHLGPVAAHSIAVRRTLISRARYEVGANSYARGMVQTLAIDTIGTGPRLQMLEADSGLNLEVERLWRQWSRTVCLARTLRTLRAARPVDGEGFLVLRRNDRIAHPIKLDPLCIECDRVVTPDALTMDPGRRMVDGIVYDDLHNPIEYHILRNHPGEMRSAGSWGEYDTVSAEFVVHYFRQDRAGQERGIPDLTPALPLFAQLRRYTLAVIAAAETAADFAAVLYTDQPPDPDATGLAPFDLVELERRMGTVLPDGYKLGQITPQQPAQTYSNFKGEILSEIARCLMMPSNIASLNSANHNYASARLDSQNYQRAIGVERDEIELTVLVPMFVSWLRVAAEAGLVPAVLGVGAEDVAYEWRWDGFDHVDPVKGARADAIDLANHSQTLASICARRGTDWEENLIQAGKELALAKRHGLVSDTTADPEEDAEETPTADEVKDAT